MNEFNELSEIILNKIILPTGCWKDYNVYYLNKNYSNSNYQLKDKLNSKSVEVLITNY